MSLATDYSGIVINQNGPARSTVSLHDIVYQTFILPNDFARGEIDPTIPPLTGLQLFVNIAPNAQAAATLAWGLDRLVGQLWLPILSGTTTGTARDGAVWFSVFFDPPLTIEPLWLTSSFRLGVQSTTIASANIS